MTRERVITTRTYRGYLVQHIEEDAFRGATPRNPDGWSKRRFWWQPVLEVEERTWTAAKAAIDRRITERGDDE